VKFEPRIGRTIAIVTIPFSLTCPLIAVVLFAVQLPMAVSQAASGAPPVVFSVISIKPTQEEFKERGDTRDGYSDNSATIRDLIVDAYDLAMPELVSGLPSWTESQRYAVEAKMDDATVTALHALPHKAQDDERDRMMQALLAERFNLKVHHEMRQISVYALVPAKGGVKLKQAGAGEKMNYRMDYSADLRLMTAVATSMGDLADALSDKDQAGRVVLDHTGITGQYDFSLKYTMDIALGTGETASDSAPSLFTALQEQLGLKLEPVKAPIDTIVVDHVERPTPN
jgi:bla regulator protein BlaR1